MVTRKAGNFRGGRWADGYRTPSSTATACSGGGVSNGFSLSQKPGAVPWQTTSATTTASHRYSVAATDTASPPPTPSASSLRINSATSPIRAHTSALVPRKSSEDTQTS